jgi:hypothetical protein
MNSRKDLNFQLWKAGLKIESLKIFKSQLSTTLWPKSKLILIKTHKSSWLLISSMMLKLLENSAKIEILTLLLSLTREILDNVMLNSLTALTETLFTESKLNIWSLASLKICGKWFSLKETTIERK